MTTMSRQRNLIHLRCCRNFLLSSECCEPWSQCPLSQVHTAQLGWPKYYTTFLRGEKKLTYLFCHIFFATASLKGYGRKTSLQRNMFPRYDIKSYRVRAALHSQSWHYCCLIARHIKYVTWSQNSCCRHSLLPTRHIFCSSLSDVLLVYYSDNMNAMSDDDYTTNVTKCRLPSKQSCPNPCCLLSK